VEAGLRAADRRAVPTARLRLPVHFGQERESAAPGSAQGLFLIVPDVEPVRDKLVTAGVEVGEIYHRSRKGSISGRTSRVA
jgi:hypothetical protein